MPSRYHTRRTPIWVAISEQKSLRSVGNDLTYQYRSAVCLSIVRFARIMRTLRLNPRLRGRREGVQIEANFARRDKQTDILRGSFFYIEQDLFFGGVFGSGLCAVGQTQDSLG